MAQRLQNGVCTECGEEEDVYGCGAEECAKSAWLANNFPGVDEVRRAFDLIEPDDLDAEDIERLFVAIFGRASDPDDSPVSDVWSAKGVLDIDEAKRVWSVIRDLAERE